jgi:hypothetical protein
MTPEQHAAEILIQGVARVESVKLVLLTGLLCFGIAALFALGWRWASARERIGFYKARDAEARELVEHSIDTITRQAADGRILRLLVSDIGEYFKTHRATFDDKERDPLAARIAEVMAERPIPLQITFERRDREAA